MTRYADPTCLAISNLKIADGCGARALFHHSEAEGKGRKGKSRHGRRTKKITSVFFTLFGLLSARCCFPFPSSPSQLRLLDRRPSPARRPLVAVAAIALSARRPICPNNDSDSDPIMCGGERRGEERRPSFLPSCSIHAFHGLGISVSLPGRLVT